MRLIVTGILAGCLTTVASAAETDQARELLQSVSEAYRNAPTITDTLVLDLEEEQTTLGLRFDRDNKRVQFDVPGMAIMAIDGKLVVTSEAVPDKYMEVPVEGTVTETLVSLFGSPESLPFHFAMRDNQGVEAYINSLSLGFLQNPKIVSMTSAGSESAMHVIELSDSIGKAHIHINPTTRLISKIRTELPPIPGMTDESIVAVINLNPVVADELAQPIAFDPGDRTKVESPEELVPKMIEVGDAAPDFTLPTLEGKQVSLKDLRGNIVVLDFWATWCIPCIRALPELEKFANWASEQGHPVKVYAVNVWEHRARTPEDRMKIASDFWKEQDLDLENLMDVEDEFITGLGIDSIPTTLIINREGKVHEVHIGYTPQLFEMLKATVSEALDLDGAAG